MEEEWKKGDIAKVNEEIPGDSSPKNFYIHETFIVKSVNKEEGTGKTLLVGGRFDSGILATRCEKSKTNHNPYPLCRSEEINMIYKTLAEVQSRRKQGK